MTKVMDLLDKTYGDGRRTLFPYICQIGTGGTGATLVQRISQMLASFGLNGFYLIADPDVIEDHNLKNQLFIQNEVGEKKADVLARRYRAGYQIGIASYSEGYVEDEEGLLKLFNTDYLQIGYSEDVFYLPIVISCVDNNFSRQIFHRFFENCPGNLLYLDVGNESVNAPRDFRERAGRDWTEEEWVAYHNSGWTGQVVCGLKLKGETVLQPVASVFPDLLQDEDEIKPSELSCNQLVASDPQRLLTNQMAAMALTVYLNELFESGTISHHITFFHAKKGYMRSEPIDSE